MTKLVIVPGSIHSASNSRALARALAEKMPEGVTAELAEIGALPHFNPDLAKAPDAEAFKRAIEEADGVILISPEYNYSVPGVLKNALDWASRPAYASPFRGKPTLVVTVSAGSTGGVRAQSHLKYVLTGMLADVFPAIEVAVPHIGQKIENGAFTDEETLTFAGGVINDFISAIRSRPNTARSAA